MLGRLNAKLAQLKATTTEDIHIQLSGNKRRLSNPSSHVSGTNTPTVTRQAKHTKIAPVLSTTVPSPTLHMLVASNSPGGMAVSSGEATEDGKTLNDFKLLHTLGKEQVYNR